MTTCVICTQFRGAKVQGPRWHSTFIFTTIMSFNLQKTRFHEALHDIRQRFVHNFSKTTMFYSHACTCAKFSWMQLSIRHELSWLSPFWLCARHCLRPRWLLEWACWGPRSFEFHATSQKRNAQSIEGLWLIIKLTMRNALSYIV